MTLIVRKIYIQTTATITERLALLKAGPPPSGPRPTAHGPVAWPSGMEIWRPGGPMALTLFSNFFCPAVNPRACTDLHRVWPCKMDDGEFEFVFHFNNLFNIILFHPFFRCILLSEKRCHSLIIRLFTKPDRKKVHSKTM